MGRHRSDPRGLARILIAVLAVVLALALLVVGGVALFNALTAEPESPGPVGSAASTETTASEPATAGTGTPSKKAEVPLLIRVTGEPTMVFVRVSGSGEVLHQGTLNTGEARQYDRTPLDVVATNGGAVKVVIYGEVQEAKPDGTRGEWFVPER